MSDLPVGLDKYHAPQWLGARASRRFHVMAKPAGSACNLDCTYCFYLGKQKLAGGPGGGHMHDDVLEQARADLGVAVAEPAPDAVLGLPAQTPMSALHVSVSQSTSADSMPARASRSPITPRAKSCTAAMKRTAPRMSDWMCPALSPFSIQSARKGIHAASAARPTMIPAVKKTRSGS
jgi:hypothetical protein